MTGASSHVARRSVSTLHTIRDLTTAAATARHPIIVSRMVRDTRAIIEQPAAQRLRQPDRDWQLSRAARPSSTTRGVEPVEQLGEIPSTGKAYRDLDDWIDAFEEWDGDTDEYDIETNADYPAE